MSREIQDDIRTPDVRSETESYHSPISTSLDSEDFDYLQEWMPPAIVNQENALPSQNIPSLVLFHCADFLRISFVTQTLLARWLHQLFLELQRYDRAPSIQIQETWLGYPIVGIAAFLGVIAKILNAVPKRENYLAAQDYIFSVFCSSIFYFFLDLLTGAESLSLGVFVVISAIVLPLFVAFFTNLALPDSSNRFYQCQGDGGEILLSRYALGNRVERFLNLGCGMDYGFTSLTALSWTINREYHGETASLPWWGMSLVGAGVLAAGKLGYDLTDHPIRFQKFVMISKFFKDASFTYAAISGIFYMIFHDRSIYQQPAFRVLLSCVCFFMGCCIGLYAAFTTRFRFEENASAIEMLINRVHAAKEAASTGLTTIKNNAVNFFATCCKKNSAETEQLLLRSDGVERNLV